MKEAKERQYPVFGLDAYSPEQVVERVMKVGVKKVRLPYSKTFALGLLGGCYISLGALYQVVVMANPDISSTAGAVISPLFYAMGYTIGFISGAEIFTSNNLTVMSYASGLVKLYEIVRNWLIVLAGNFLGSIVIVTMFFYSGSAGMFDGLLAENMLLVTSAKMDYTILQMFLLGVLGNLLIVAGVWLSMAGRTVTDKYLALFLPLSAVPAMGFQHATGNMFHFFLSFLLLNDYSYVELPTEITLLQASLSLVVVAFGNIFGGGVLIGLSYYFIFVRGKI
ncbi:formate/nitrite transporter [Cyclonatronum proteinivorum]|uniref:Formate/nitrite transporter n=1 Tax=Cyclonatronum proteinivorum TaxID=1457365 RepID=A0A345UFY1_9BACT|nr:formate/nitrite transporter family protein [Cyclonatronum proteinivorum]AXI99382.1 formate/nitrite transporter [Cyclonatronum proteinivorum]